MAGFTRRALLQSAALAVGGTLASPFVRRGWAAAPSAARLVLVVEGNGTYPRAFLSDLAKQALGQGAAGSVQSELNFANHYPDAPLVVTGDPLATPIGSLRALGGTTSLTHKAAVVLGLSSTITGGGHTTYQGGLACARGDASKTPAITIDAAIAAKLSGNTPFSAVRLGIGSGRLSYQICALGPGRAAPVIVDPVAAYDALFGTIVGGANAASVARRRAALTFASEDVQAALGVFAGGASERAKLEGYRDAIQTSQARQDRLQQLRASVLPLVPPGPADDPRYASEDAIDRLAVQFDLAAASLIGGLTNVVVLSIGPGLSALGLTYPSIVGRHLTGDLATMGRHQLQHGNSQPAYQDAIMDVTAEHVSLLADLARKLDATAEPSGGGGSMLDHTAVVYMSDSGEQHHSKAEEWPILVVGGSALGLKTDGRTIVYPAHGSPENRQVSNFFNTLGHATGDTTMDAFGNEGTPRLRPGPLDELYSPST